MSIATGVVANGVNLESEFGLVLDGSQSDWYTPPKVNTSYISVEGRIDGPLDMTEAISDTPTYGQRSQTLVFWLDPTRAKYDLYELRRRLYILLHGRKVKYTLPHEEGYTYTGRWNMDSWSRAFPSLKDDSGTFKFSVVAEPYKFKKTITQRLNAAGGVVFALESGMKPVCPTFEFASASIVRFGNNIIKSNAGAYKLTDVWLTEGVNEIYVNSMLGTGDRPISDFGDATIASLGNAYISQLAWMDVVTGAKTIADFESDTINQYPTETIAELTYVISQDADRYAVYVQYDWSDL